jgi:hypothetical protein
MALESRVRNGSSFWVGALLDKDTPAAAVPTDNPADGDEAMADDDTTSEEDAAADESPADAKKKSGKVREEQSSKKKGKKKSKKKKSTGNSTSSSRAQSGSGSGIPPAPGGGGAAGGRRAGGQAARGAGNPAPGDAPGQKRPAGRQHVAQPPGPDPKLVEKVMEIQNRHTKALMKQKGVVGVGTGVDEEGNVVIKVCATGADDPQIPKAIEGVPVEVTTTGPIIMYAAPSFGRRDRIPRPVPIGVSSIADTGVCASGTLGCRLKDKEGKVYALSNNHVYADFNTVPIGGPAVQPSPGDNFCLPPDESDVIGRLARFVPLDLSGNTENLVDCAILSTTTALVNTSTLTDGYGVPRGTTRKAFLGQQLQKYGRTTGYTRGTVNTINFTVSIGAAVFVDQISVIGDGFPSLGAPGDSGSLVVDMERYPVGLLFAGGGGITILNVIDNVLEKLGGDLSIDDSPATPIGKAGKSTPNSRP